MISPSVLALPYPVAPLMSALGVQEILSVVVAPVAVAVTAVAHVLAEIAPVPSAEVPLATTVTEPPPPSTCSHPAAVTEVQAGAAVPLGALQTYSWWFVVSVAK